MLDSDRNSPDFRHWQLTALTRSVVPQPAISPQTTIRRREWTRMNLTDWPRNLICFWPAAAFWGCSVFPMSLCFPQRVADCPQSRLKNPSIPPQSRHVLRKNGPNPV
jgi:hypothetical protein